MKAQIDNFSIWVAEIDPVTLTSGFKDLLLDSGFGILNFMEHHFEPQGYTAIWLLSESHLAIHTFPEESKSYVELSSCNKEMYDNFIVQLNKSDTLSPLLADAKH